MLSALRSAVDKLLSGDRVDVVSIMEDRTVAIEVKSKDSDWFDLRRGVYQCVKYRAVMKAQDIRRNANVESWLVTECQRRSKSTPLAGVKMHHLMRFSPALAVVPVVHRRDPRCFV